MCGRGYEQAQWVFTSVMSLISVEGTSPHFCHDVGGVQVPCKQSFTALPVWLASCVQIRQARTSFYRNCHTDWYFFFFLSQHSCSAMRISFDTRVEAWHPPHECEMNRDGSPRNPALPTVLGRAGPSSIRYGWIASRLCVPSERKQKNKPSGENAAEATNIPPLCLLGIWTQLLDFCCLCKKVRVWLQLFLQNTFLFLQ